MKHPKDRELIKEYEQALASGTTKSNNMAGYMNERAKAGLKSKITAHLQAMAEREAEAEKKRPHTYGDIIKTAKKAKADIEKLTGKPEELLQAKRAELNKEFDDLVEAELFTENNRALWVAGNMEKFLQSEEYLTVKNDLREATNLYAECLALKEQWEQDNADIIEAERVRSKREELMQADPETLKALGITPDPSLNPSKKSVDGSKEAGSEDNELLERESALRSIHPYATEDEIRAMARL